MHFDSFSLGARHLFQKLVLFFLCEVILVILFCFQNKNLSEFLKKVPVCLTLNPLELYVNLVDHLVPYSQPFNLVLR
jgi:hypothetical protein